MARSIYCSKCKKEKEESVRNESYCKACKSERIAKARIKKRIELGLSPTRPIRKAYCDNCIAKLERNEDIRGRCPECHRIAQQHRVEDKREHEGLPRKTTRDSKFCYICNIPKVDGRCIPCRRRLAKERKARKREEKGLRPWGSGRPLTCYKCGNIKEHPKRAFCDSCKREDDKIRWKEVYAPRMNQKEITMVCECGKEKKSTRKFYCEECLVARKRNRTKIAAQVRRDKLKRDGFILVAEVLTEDEKKMRQAARNYLNRLIRQGLVKRKNCEICGSDKNVEAHHEDYGKPLEVRWLCRVHHDDMHHKNNPEQEK